MNNNVWRNCFFGTDTPMKTDRGFLRRTFLNNAATPQVAKPVINQLNHILSIYSYDNEPNCASEEIKYLYNNVRNIVMEYVKGDPSSDTVIFTQNTTMAINILSDIFYQIDKTQVVLTTSMEHMANYLPYKEKFQTVLIGLREDGSVDMEDYKRKLQRFQGRVKLVAVTGASNITGIIPPYHEMAALAHRYGAKLLLDAVQLVQHREFNMKPHTEEMHIDFVTFDGHKCYTGQSGGVLIGDKGFLDQYMPLFYGAGITDFVSEKQIVYRSAPQRYEAGYPDFLGIISLGNALLFLKNSGLSHITHYESNLYNCLLEKLNTIPGIILYGTNSTSSYVPFVTFNLKGMSYKSLGEELGHRYGISIAYGTSGANIYVQKLLGLTDDQAYNLYSSGEGYGIVRASLGMFNNLDDIDNLVNALRCIAYAK